MIFNPTFKVSTRSTDTENQIFKKGNGYECLYKKQNRKIYDVSGRQAFINLQNLLSLKRKFELLIEL